MCWKFFEEEEEFYTHIKEMTNLNRDIHLTEELFRFVVNSNSSFMPDHTTNRIIRIDLRAHNRNKNRCIPQYTAHIDVYICSMLCILSFAFTQCRSKSSRSKYSNVFIVQMHFVLYVVSLQHRFTSYTTHANSMCRFDVFIFTILHCRVVYTRKIAVGDEERQTILFDLFYVQSIHQCYQY